MSQNAEKLKEQANMLQGLPLLQQRLEETRSRLEATEYEAETLRAALNDAARRLSSVTEGRDAMVAKPLVAKIFSTYLHPTTTVASKTELLHLMANILELTDEERRPLGIAPIKPPEGSVGPTATPGRGLVSMISSVTGSVVSGSLNKGRQWLSWGGQKSDSAAGSSSDSSSAPMPSLADVWIKILLEGSDNSRAQAEAKATSAEAPEPPAEAFKAPFPFPSSSSALSSSSSALSTSSATFSIPPMAQDATSSSPAPMGAPLPHTPIPHSQPHRSLPSTYVPVPRATSSQSPYLSQQQAMRSAFQAQSQSFSETPTKPS
jgi:hypothetical protein